MPPATTPPPPPPPTRELAAAALQANKDHLNALRVYTDGLEAELHNLDKLVRIVEKEPKDDDAGGTITVPGAKRAVGPLSSADLLSPDSPFYADAEKRTRYLNYVTIHTMKGKELEALSDAVKTENHRKYAFESQKRGYEAINNSAQIDFEKNTDGLEWDLIAERVSKVSTVPRTARECEIRWIGDRHPQINHKPWDAAEVARLKDLVADALGGPVDWVAVAAQLGTNRMPIDCMRKAMSRVQHAWTPESDARLLAAIKRYGTNNWPLVACAVSEDATAYHCQGRYTRTLDPALARGAWTPAEDARLRAAVAAYGPAWVDVAAVVPGRNNDQCRDRWTDRLSPALAKGKWTEDEEARLCGLVEKVGPRWKEVSEQLGSGRTDNQCRTRYDKLKKQGLAAARPVVGQQPVASGSGTAGEAAATAIPVDVATTLQEPPRPRPRPRRKQTAAAEETPDATADPKPRPKPRPRAKKAPTAVPVEGAPADDQALSSNPVEEDAEEGPEDLPADAGDTTEDDEDAPVGKGKKRAASTDGEEEYPKKKKRKTAARRTPKGKKVVPVASEQAGDVQENANTTPVVKKRPGRPRKVPLPADAPSATDQPINAPNAVPPERNTDVAAAVPSACVPSEQSGDMLVDASVQSSPAAKQGRKLKADKPQPTRVQPTRVQPSRRAAAKNAAPSSTT